ncbi:hypothetical protein BJP40_28175 [Streptomyces sp. CC53]|uniref:hypothetical protein n=1 Tax=unclassified Streptomyces TaxID=2593676 RepID=UPI0008DDE430|nr:MULTISPECIES: hypothetical protein [unclassified Streptomyces]OII62668.1 hypothetical protein BJP40_28175 [Streptomyces sp. CC53]
MFKPQYPAADTPPSTTGPLAVPEPIRPTTPPAPARPGLVDQVRANPAAAVVGTVAVGAVVTSTLLAVAITGIALSISGVVLLLLVRLLRQDLHR